MAPSTDCAGVRTPSAMTIDTPRIQSPSEKLDDFWISRSPEVVAGGPHIVGHIPSILTVSLILGSSTGDVA